MHVIDILDTVGATLNQRGKDNGYDTGGNDVDESKAEERSAAEIARIYTALSGQEMSTANAWLFLMSLKLARLKSQLVQGKDVSDTVIDLVAYSGLYGEEITKPQAELVDPETPVSWHEHELRKIAKIMTGSDAPGELRALSVTAQSYVDRCKALAAGRQTLSAESWANLEKLMAEPASPTRGLIELLARRPGSITRKVVESAVASIEAAMCPHDSWDERGHCVDCGKQVR